MKTIKPIRKYVCVEKSVKKETYNNKDRWGIFRLCNYHKIYLYPQKTFKTLEKAEEYIKHGKLTTIGTFVTLKIGSVNGIERRIINEKEATKKNYAIFSKSWSNPIIEFHGVIKVCDMKQAEEIIGKRRYFILSLRKSNNRIPIRMWNDLIKGYGKPEAKVEKSKAQTDFRIKVYDYKIEDIRPTNEELVADKL